MSSPLNQLALVLNGERGFLNQDIFPRLSTTDISNLRKICKTAHDHKKLLEAHRARIKPVIMAAGYGYLFIFNNGRLYGMGPYDHHQGSLLGERSRMPTEIRFFKDRGQVVDQIVAGGKGTFFQVDGRWYGIGENNSGQLALGHQYSSSILIELTFFKESKLNLKQIAKGESHSAFLTHEGQWFLSSTNGVPVLQPNLTIDHIAVGDRYCLARARNGTWYGLGNNRYGQLGRPADHNDLVAPTQLTFFKDRDHEIERIVPGCGHLFIRRLGDWYSVGNFFDRTDRHVPIKVHAFNQPNFRPEDIVVMGDDRLFFCTDGVWSYYGKDQITAVKKSYKTGIHNIPSIPMDPKQTALPYVGPLAELPPYVPPVDPEPTYRAKVKELVATYMNHDRGFFRKKGFCARRATKTVEDLNALAEGNKPVTRESIAEILAARDARRCRTRRGVIHNSKSTFKSGSYQVPIGHFARNPRLSATDKVIFGLHDCFYAENDAPKLM